MGGDGRGNGGDTGNDSESLRDEEWAGEDMMKIAS